MAMSKKQPSGKTSDGRKIVATNRRAFHEYHVLERFEAGLKLTGSEVKSLRAGHCNILDAHAMIDRHKDEVTLFNLQIPEYRMSGDQIETHEPKRKRRLLMRREEIKKLRGRLVERGFTLVPLSVYFKRGWAKVELGLCKGKKLYDKRHAIKEREAKRFAERRVR